MEVEPQAGPATGWTWAATAPAPAAPTPGSERTRPDTSIVGVDHEKLQQSIANWASTLSPKWQKPAAMLATFPADVLASLAEMFSAPESVAGAAAPKAVPALTAAGEQIGAARQALAKPADLAIDALLKRSGLDPSAIDLATTRMRLAAARSQTRQARLTAEGTTQPAPATTAAAPAAGAPAAAAQSTPAPAPTAPATAAPPDLGKMLKTLMTEGGLNLEEANRALQWMKQGVPLETIQQRIQAARALQQSGTFGKLPTADEMQRAIAESNRRNKRPK